MPPPELRTYISRNQLFGDNESEILELSGLSPGHFSDATGQCYSDFTDVHELRRACESAIHKMRIERRGFIEFFEIQGRESFQQAFRILREGLQPWVHFRAMALNGEWFDFTGMREGKIALLSGSLVCDHVLALNLLRLGKPTGFNKQQDAALDQACLERVFGSIDGKERRNLLIKILCSVYAALGRESYLPDTAKFFRLSSRQLIRILRKHKQDCDQILVSDVRALKKKHLEDNLTMRK